MIDKENEVYTLVKKAIIAEFPNANVSSVYAPTVAKFPHVSIVQTDSTENTDFRDSSNEEKIVNLNYQIDIYSNDTAKGKTECKKILKIVDDTLRRKNFRRTVLTPVPNQNDASIYRLTVQYTVSASQKYFYSM